MINKVKNKEKADPTMVAEFDSIADYYYESHKKNLAITGESPEYFAEYKVKDLSNLLSGMQFEPKSILDFGCGIGNSIPYFRKYLQSAKLYCADVSSRSMEIAINRHPGQEEYILINEAIPLENNSIDVAFSACVFHHIPKAVHNKWMNEIRRVVRPGGLFIIYEHNPLNPLTVRAVKNCPIDVNAELISAREIKSILLSSGWECVTVNYKIFFPAQLKILRPVEIYLEKFFIGAQWRSVAINKLKK